MKKSSSISCKKFYGYSYNKIHRAYDSTSRYLKLSLILAIEERHHTEVEGPAHSVCFPTVSHQPPISSVEKHVFFSQFTQILAFHDPVEYDSIYQEKKNPRKNMPVLAM